jgi:hypothetical protein
MVRVDFAYRSRLLPFVKGQVRPRSQRTIELDCDIIKSLPYIYENFTNLDIFVN